MGQYHESVYYYQFFIYALQRLRYNKFCSSKFLIRSLHSSEFCFNYTKKDLVGDSILVLSKMYILKGSDRSTCGANGSWEEPLPSCELISCRSPPEIKDATYVFATSKKNIYGSVILYNCYPDYRIRNSGPFALVCEEEGEWIGNTPECLPPCLGLEVSQCSLPLPFDI